jgi:hypothetical protein
MISPNALPRRPSDVTQRCSHGTSAPSVSSCANSCGSDDIGCRSSPRRRYALIGSVEIECARSRFAANTGVRLSARDGDPICKPVSR